MRHVLLIALTMTAFALNSVLNRAAVASGAADPALFALIRTVAGALVLALLVSTRKRSSFEFKVPRRWLGAVALAVYMVGFSLAYATLDAGLGALVLFGTVQIVLFGAAIAFEARPTFVQVFGAIIAFSGLVIALWPSAQFAVPWLGALMMILAGAGWAFYTLAGKGTADPLASTATQFLLSMPMVCVLLFFVQDGVTVWGFMLASVAGAVTSGLGYALWYSVLPQLPGARAGIVQLTVPILAILMGAVFLGEALSWKIGLASGFVVGGVALALTGSKVRAGHR